ncbi:hypothetical protein AX17_006513 [Amanita inopinata Kibby_2008]|nr:hypothetical protein AX17_006513 [Amanita inopinata Kibby_2008]
MRKVDLKLEEPLEVDIGEYNHEQDDFYSAYPYTSYLHTPGSQPKTSTSALSPAQTSSTSFLPVSTRIPSASSAQSLSSLDPSPNPSPAYMGTPPTQYSDPAHISAAKGCIGVGGLGQYASPSSPALTRFGLGLGNESGNVLVQGRPATLTRSRTLPRVSQVEVKPTRRKKSEVDGLEMDQDVVDKLRRWILGIAVVEFDLDHGPVIDGIFPPMLLLPAESENIAFSAFPDSSQFEEGSQIHSFRIREQIQSVVAEKRPPTKDGFIYGFSHFTQKKDPSSKRGYRQRSVVILTQHQYPAFFSCLSSIFGPLYDAHGLPMLESACHNIATWRDPSPGQTMELGFLGSVLHLELPNTLDEQQLTETSSFKERYDPRIHILASSPPLIPPPIRLFESSLSNLWSIWECLVLCEPILIFGSSPAQTSQAVWWLRDVTRPIPFAGDIRPYITMQDGDHSLLVNRLPPKAGILLGVTNPFFEKSCSHWPHILSLGKSSEKSAIGGTAKPSPSLGSAVLAGPRSGWSTKTHKRYISKDRVLLKQLEAACKGSERNQLNGSLALRRHFCSRTRDFLAPLSRYLHTLIPSPAELTNATINDNIRMKPFNSAHFLASLKANGCTLPFRSSRQRTEFYERWLKTPAFGLWLAQQEHIVHLVLGRSVHRT